MDDSNSQLFDNLDRGIDIAFSNLRQGAIYSDFVLEAAELDARLYWSRTIPDQRIRELWEYADEYFHRLARGEARFRNMDWEQAEADFNSRREEMRRIFHG